MNKGIILLFLSDYRESEEGKYKSNIGVIKGSQTNDAPVKYLIKKAYEKDNKDNLKVLCIASKKVYTEKISEDGKEIKSTYERFKNILFDYSKEFNNMQINVAPLFYDFRMNKNELVNVDKKDIPQYLYEQMIEEIGSERNEAYIDYTGGMRDISFLMVSLMRYLEFRSVNCKNVVYSDFVNKKIIDINYIYNIYQMINGLSEFVTTGNAYQLENIFGNNKPELIKSIVEFSRTMSLCDVDNVAEKIINVAEQVNKLKNQKISEDMETELYLNMLKSMLPLVNEKMYIDKIVMKNSDNENYNINYPYLIKWCINNRMIQQALTLYVEKMPVYFVENNIISIPQDVEINKSMGASREASYFYGNLFDNEIENDRKKLIDEFISIINENEINDGVYNLRKIKNNLVDKGNKNHENFGEYYLIFNDFIEENYDNYGNKISSTQGLAKTFSGYFNNVKNGTLPKKINDKLGTNSKTYTKKVMALENIERLKKAEYQNIFKRMQYYLVVKFIRNNINHAADIQNRSEDEKDAIKYFKKKGIIDTDIIGYDQVIKTVNDGIDIEI